MDHGGDGGDCGNSASGYRESPGMGPIDAHEANALLGALEFDSALSFLDDLDDLNASVESLLHEPASSISVHAPSVAARTTSGPSDGCGDLRKNGIRVRSLASHVVESERPTPTARTTRERQKQEMEYLRSKIVELEAELAELQASPDSSPSALVETSVWEKIAKRQSEARQQAAIENARLRGLLASQLKVARSLEKLLNKRSSCEASEGFTERKRLRVAQLLDASAILEEIRGRIHSQFDDVDVVMTECGLSIVTTDLDDAQATVRATADNAVCLEVTLAKVLPFPIDQVADTIWQCLSVRHVEMHNGHVGVSLHSDGTCDLHAALKIQLRRAQAIVHIHGVGALRTEAERSLIVAEAAGMTQGTLFARDPIHYRERGYVLIEKHAASCVSGTAPSPSTMIKACVHLWPEHASSGGETPGGSLHFASFIDLVIGGYDQEAKALLQVVENILLEKSLQTR